MTNLVCIKNKPRSKRKCMVFSLDSINIEDAKYEILKRKCAIHGGKISTDTSPPPLCSDSPLAIEDSDIKILLDRDIIDAIRHDSLNRFVSLLTESNRINDIARPIDYNYEGNTLLHEAIYWNSNKCILYLLKSCNNSLNSENKDGNTVLHIACIKGHSFLINELYKLGSNISRRNQKKETILHCAVKCGKLEVVKQVYEIINNIECISCSDEKGRNVLHTAVMSRNRTMDIIRFLVNQGSDVINLENGTGYTIMTNLNRLEKNSLNIQIKTFIKKSLYDIYKKDRQDTTAPGTTAFSTSSGTTAFSTAPGTTAFSTSEQQGLDYMDYDTIIRTYPEYSPYIIDTPNSSEEDNTVVNNYNVTYKLDPGRVLPNSALNQPIDVDKYRSKKVLPIKFKPLFEYFDDGVVRNNKKKKSIKMNVENKKLMYREILFICLLFVCVFIFYYE